METQLTINRVARQSDAPDSSTASEELSQIQAGCQRLADAADVEIDRALNGGITAEEFLRSTQQVRGGQ